MVNQHHTAFESLCPSRIQTTVSKGKVLVEKDLQDVISKNASYLSIEDILTVVCEPEAVFKVRQITRCSSTLSGKLLLLGSPVHLRKGLNSITKISDYRPRLSHSMRFVFPYRFNARNKLR